MASPTPTLPRSTESQQGFARQVLEAEAEAIRRVVIDQSLDRAVAVVREAVAAGGSLVVTGLGKSGLIGQKLSATFSSTGTPSHFLHPVEAFHGDLGRIRRGDAVLLLSYSGNTEELLTLAEVLRQDGVPMIALTREEGPGNGLSRLADVTLAVGEITEACALALAPSSSTTATLALGDALALSVSRARKFTADQFQKHHPAGGLGRQLTAVVDAMRFYAPRTADGGADASGSDSGAGSASTAGNIPLIGLGTRVSEAYAAAERQAKDSGLRRPGALLMVDERGRLAGIVTDGDLRSALIEVGPEVWQGPIDAIMTRNPTTLPDTALVRDAVHIVRQKRFDEIPVVDAERRPVGLIDVQDLAALKVIEG